MIARRRFLLECPFVLLVDDDQTEPARRREDRAPSPDHDLHLSSRDTPPMAAALGIPQVTVQHRHVAAAAPETLNSLGGQADLRNEDNRFLALAYSLLDGAQIN